MQIFAIPDRVLYTQVLGMVLIFTCKDYTFVAHETIGEVVFGIVSINAERFIRVTLSVNKDTETMTGLLLSTADNINEQIDDNAVKQIYMDVFMRGLFDNVFVRQTYNNVEKCLLVRMTANLILENYRLFKGIGV